ncbi:threonine dehydratase [Dendrobium catenatum]|uniref:Threonine dehydratase n=1 Tax=Dendrobium catenatum TaxID=906689 RepID=A0A2I0X9J5_9ASPA|nr:threonine dehydratase [Dendrobium catenatum]
MGDFKCCQFPSDKLGGNALHQNQLSDFNGLIFYANLKELASVGPSYTWFNQRTINPIHIKLDRMLVNDDWMEAYPNSHYVVKPPKCSDHCPIILMPCHKKVTHHRFLFKNYWIKSKDFWYLLLSIFTGNFREQPFVALCSCLRN